jgi:hypothetical protein
VVASLRDCRTAEARQPVDDHADLHGNQEECNGVQRRLLVDREQLRGGQHPADHNRDERNN